MTIIDYIKRAFYKPCWKLAYRECNKENLINGIQGKSIEFNILNTEGNFWCADPFVVSEFDKKYIFCECFINEKNKGAIAVGEYKNGKLNDMKIIIEQNYHMSYPCVFKYNSEYYMIPETSDNRTIELYKAKEFPYEWELIKTLKRNIKIVDLTAFISEDEIFFIGYKLENKKNKICIYKLNMISKAMDLLSEIEDDDKGRPAGSILILDNKILRPAQLSVRKYGESIIFKEIISINKIFCEKEFSKLESKDLLIKGEKNIHRIHTINIVDNFVIIDYSCDSFELLRPFKILIKKLLVMF